MIVAKFAGSSVSTVYGLAQWDYGQELAIEYATMDIPDGSEAQFYQGELSHTDYVSENRVMIPDLMLQSNANITVYIYVRENGKGETVLAVRLPIRGRPKPENYILPEQKEYLRLLPAGGTPGQFMRKSSSENYAAEWGYAADNIKIIDGALQLMSGDSEIGDRIRIEGGTGNREIELKNDGSAIRWRYTDSNEWFELAKTEDLMGPAGITPEFEIREGHLIAKYNE